MPLAIGASHVYAASLDPVEERYLLVAEDFTTARRRYASAGLPLNWPFAYDHFHDFQNFQFEFAKVARISDEEELILQLKQTGSSSFPEIEIVRGSDGTLMGCVAFTGPGLNCVMSHPPTGHIAFTTQATRLPQKVLNPLESLGRYGFFITRRFSDDGQAGLRLVSVDVVLVPKDWLIRPNYRMESLVVIDPFNRTAFISSARKPREEYSNSRWTLWSCPLILTEDAALSAAAMAAIPDALEGSEDTEGPNVVGQCYVLAEGGKVKLPAKPKKGRDKREPLSLPDPMGSWYGRVAGGQLSLFLDEEYYALNFI
ncbi:hypothetical protein BJY00DRAFT_108892 [Aspergillus carlsbadensis]|nr:hypothetical protein BJY00DRAFT_108892 [Aspergillus carlsbadensis]